MNASYDDSFTKIPIFASPYDDLVSPMKNYKQSKYHNVTVNIIDEADGDIDGLIDGISNLDINTKLEAIDTNVSKTKDSLEKEQKSYDDKYEEQSINHIVQSIEDIVLEDIIDEQIKYIVREYKINHSNTDSYIDYINEIDSKYRQTIISKYQIDLTGDNLQCLKDGQWLNDNVVNFYYAMLQERNDYRVEHENEPPIRFFNTYFYNKLIQGGKYNYAGVRRWSRKFDVFAQDKIFIPINTHNMHWTLILLDMLDKVIYYVDSLGGSGDYIFENILQYLKDEHMDKKKTEYADIDAWICESCRRYTPQQHNGSDCGVFMLTATEFLSEGFTSLSFKQSQMRYFRRRLLCLIMNQSLIE